MDPHLAFYTVCLSFLPVGEHYSHVQHLLACDFEWSERPGPCYSEFAGFQARCFQCYRPFRFPRVCPRILHSCN
jgi:hypothetical protein